MNRINAVSLAKQVAELVCICATFQAKYGRHYNLKPESSSEAWQEYERINAQQITIAQMLDVDALLKPSKNLNKWWENQDLPDLSLGDRLMSEVTHLISACAYMENEDSATSYSVFCAQSVIAGMLHPSALQVALGNLENQRPVR